MEVTRVLWWSALSEPKCLGSGWCKIKPSARSRVKVSAASALENTGCRHCKISAVSCLTQPLFLIWYCHPLVYTDTALVWRNQSVISKELTHSITGHNPTLDWYIMASNTHAGVRNCTHFLVCLSQTVPQRWMCMVVTKQRAVLTQCDWTQQYHSFIMQKALKNQTDPKQSTAAGQSWESSAGQRQTPRAMHPRIQGG